MISIAYLSAFLTDTSNTCMWRYHVHKACGRDMLPTCHVFLVPGLDNVSGITEILFVRQNIQLAKLNFRS